MDLDDFETITKKPLKLDSKNEKKKKKSSSGKSSKKPRDDPIAGISSESRVIVTNVTKAEMAFKSKQAKIAEERILKKASKTHKQRVEEFNKHLDSLSEHYDIPKVSWTK